MEAKTTRFLTQFSRAVFEKWTQSSKNEKFWEDSAALRSLLKEAVAKLPSGKLKVQLTRDLTPLETSLATLLRELYATYVQEHQIDTNRSFTVPLNEAVTELALSQADAALSSDKQRNLAGVLALDAGIDLASSTTDTQTEEFEELVETFALIAARAYEAPHEQQHKRGLVLKRLATRVQQKIQTFPKKWSCSENADASKQVKRLRLLLERILGQDVVALAQERHARHGESFPTGHLQAPWTTFYRPEESKELQQVVFDEEMAKIYGARLVLAIYYPIDDESKEEETSNESSEDEEQRTLEQRSHKQKILSVVTQTQLTTRQVLLAAQMRQRGLQQNGQWLISLLTFLHGLATPVTYLDEDGDDALDEQARHALLDCLGQVYSRAFASVKLFEPAKERIVEKTIAEQDRALFRAIVCLRHAAHFMRVERKSSLSAITTAMAHVAGVPLPATFVSWLDHEHVANPISAIEQAVQRLWKNCIGQNRMVNILLNATDVTTEQLPLIQESYYEYLSELADITSNKPKNRANLLASADAAKETAFDANSIFYVDHAGEDDVKPKKTKKKRANKKKKKRASENTAEASSKRGRTLSD